MKLSLPKKLIVTVWGLAPIFHLFAFYVTVQQQIAEMRESIKMDEKTNGPDFSIFGNLAAFCIALALIGSVYAIFSYVRLPTAKKMRTFIYLQLFGFTFGTAFQLLAYASLVKISPYIGLGVLLTWGLAVFLTGRNALKAA